MARGTLRLYLGAAPGVGKTYAMLNEGWRRKERGTDVVIGRVRTTAVPKRCPDRYLEIFTATVGRVPCQMFGGGGRRRVLHAGAEQVLVDELAHTNVPGLEAREALAGHRQRSMPASTYLDGEHPAPRERSTMWSSGSPGWPSRKRSPTRWPDADQLELVDMSPEALRRRLAHGNVYPPERVDADSATTSASATYRPARAGTAVGGRPGRRGLHDYREARHRRAVGDQGAGGGGVDRFARRRGPHPPRRPDGPADQGRTGRGARPTTTASRVGPTELRPATGSCSTISAAGTARSSAATWRRPSPGGAGENATQLVLGDPPAPPDRAHPGFGHQRVSVRPAVHSTCTSSPPSDEPETDRPHRRWPGRAPRTRPAAGNSWTSAVSTLRSGDRGAVAPWSASPSIPWC